MCPAFMNSNSIHAAPRAPSLLAVFGVAACLAGAAPAAGAASASCEPRDLGFDRPEAGWVHQPLSKLKRDTVYKVVSAEGHTSLLASADQSASAFVMRLKPAVAAPEALSWRWKTAALVPGADNRDKSREDAPLRVMLGFDGDLSKLPQLEQSRLAMAKRLTGTQPPYALLMYIWSDGVKVDTIIPSAHTSQVKMLVVASGNSGLGAWQSVRRNVAEDYRRAFGAEPGPVVGVAVMTDTDNTGKKAAGEYADIRFECTP
jgi:hypothetical protein